MTNLSSPFSLIKTSLGIFLKQENMIYFAKVYLPLIPFSIISVIQVYLRENGMLTDSRLMGFFSVFNFLYFLFYFWIAVSGILAVDAVISGKKEKIKGLYKTAWKKTWKYLILSLLTVFLIVLGLVLLIIPGIILMIWFSFSSYELILENRGVTRSLGESKRLVKGRFWKVFGRLIIFGVFGILVQLLFVLIPYLGTVIYPLAGALFVLPNYLLYQELKSIHI
jgi:hypothetical protein